MLNKLWSKLLCRLNWHEWLMVLRGHTFQGSVFPIRFRTCQRCDCWEQEVFNELSHTANWVKIDKNKAHIHLE